MRRDVFQAIADPTRRNILGMIAQNPLNMNSVSDKFDVSRAAVYKHLKILTECGLVIIKQQGRERFCEAKLEKLNEVSDWVNQYRKFWTEKLDSLESYLIELQAKEAEVQKKIKAKNLKQKTRAGKQESKNKKQETRNKKSINIKKHGNKK